MDLKQALSNVAVCGTSCRNLARQTQFSKVEGRFRAARLFFFAFTPVSNCGARACILHFLHFLSRNVENNATSSRNEMNRVYKRVPSLCCAVRRLFPFQRKIVVTSDPNISLSVRLDEETRVLITDEESVM